MAHEVKRASRVAQGLHQELSTLLVTQAKDPRLGGVLVSRVEVTDDLRHARVYFRLLEGGGDDASRDQALSGLARAAGMLRREVTQRLGLRHSPELRFYYDEGQDRAMRIEQLLDEVRREKK
jgi:ribosome-binding factor A